MSWQLRLDLGCGGGGWGQGTYTSWVFRQIVGWKLYWKIPGARRRKPCLYTYSYPCGLPIPKDLLNVLIT